MTKRKKCIYRLWQVQTFKYTHMYIKIAKQFQGFLILGRDIEWAKVHPCQVIYILLTMSPWPACPCLPLSLSPSSNWVLPFFHESPSFPQPHSYPFLPTATYHTDHLTFPLCRHQWSWPLMLPPVAGHKCVSLAHMLGLGQAHQRGQQPDTFPDWSFFWCHPNLG